MTAKSLPDGLEALRAEFALPEIMQLIERTARWVDPATFKLLPVWYPEFSRGAYLYDKKWLSPRMNKSRQTGQSERKREGNVQANKALTSALGLRSDDRPNWSCCHIWGRDDPSFQEANHVVQDNRFYSCVANMVLLPTPLKAFTDAMPDVKAMLRVCASNLYGWQCDHDSIAEIVTQLTKWNDWNAYPQSWPKKPGQSVPMGVVKQTEEIRRSATRRLTQIRSDLHEAGREYPREKVQNALSYWKIQWRTDENIGRFDTSSLAL